MDRLLAVVREGLDDPARPKDEVVDAEIVQPEIDRKPPTEH